MNRNTLLATGLLFSAYTQLRFPGLPIGPGELCLLAWLGLVGLTIIWQLDKPLGRAARVILGFWLVMAAAMSVGLMTSFVVGELHVPKLVRHDIMAYALMASISFAMAVQSNLVARLKGVTRQLVVIGSLTLALQLLEGWGIIDVPRTEPWFYDRLAGWSSNANQLGLLCLILTFLSLQLADTGKRARDVIFGLAGAVLPIIVGLLTKSDAFVIALFFCVTLYAGIKIVALVLSRNRMPIATLALFVALSAPVIIVALAPLAYALSQKSSLTIHGGRGGDIGAISQDIDERTALWRMALEKSSRYRMFGLGPGPHLTRLSHLRHPRTEPIPSFEAHNTLFDILLQAGLPGVFALLALGALAIAGNFSARRYALLTLLLGILLYGATHFIIRHPIVWFVLVSSLVPAATLAASRPQPDLQRVGRNNN